MLPVNDHDDHDNHDHHDNNRASSSNAAALERVSRGKRPLNQQTEDIVWNNGHWQTERQQLLKALEKSNCRMEPLSCQIGNDSKWNSDYYYD